MKNFIGSGDQISVPSWSIIHPAIFVQDWEIMPGTLVCWDGVSSAFNQCVGVLVQRLSDGDGSDNVDVMLSGIFDVPCVAADDIGIGVRLYFDTGSGLVGLDDDSGKFPVAGTSVRGSETGDGTVRIALGRVYPPVLGP